MGEGRGGGEVDGAGDECETGQRKEMWEKRVGGGVPDEGGDERKGKGQKGVHGRGFAQDTWACSGYGCPTG